MRVVHWVPPQNQLAFPLCGLWASEDQAVAEFEKVDCPRCLRMSEGMNRHRPPTDAEKLEIANRMLTKVRALVANHLEHHEKHLQTMYEKGEEMETHRPCESGARAALALQIREIVHQ